MIISSDLYNADSNSMMNCGIQYDSRHTAFPGLVEGHWMAHLQPSVKEEPRDDNDYIGYVKKERASLTPPGLSSAYSTFPTPDYPQSFARSVPRAATVTPPNPQEVLQERPRQNSPVNDDCCTLGNPSATSKSPRLTPPASIPSPTPSAEKHDGSQSSNSEGEYYENGDSLKRLQIALQRTGMIPEEKLQCPMCDFSCHVRSQFNEHLVSHETKCSICDFNTDTVDKLKEHLRVSHDCDEDMLLDEEPGLTTPKVNSQGKVKTFRCKQCEFSAVTKLEFWEHSRSHIKQERLLTCPRCPFVTEYKHHLEYHLRNHFGSKPFKCDKCQYSCVNKSMLNSHLKSHSNVYQFRCSDCTYATKYCHSLKLHLRKYGHNPAMVLNPDGSPNPLPIVDVYGTKRGPKQKTKGSPEKTNPGQQSQTQQQQQQQQGTQAANLPVHLFNAYSLLPTQMPYFNIINGFSPFPPFSPEVRLEEKNNNIEKPEDIREELKAPLDLTLSEKQEDEEPPEPMETPVETPVLKNRRKGKAFKLERVPLRLPYSDDEDSEMCLRSDSPPSPPQVSVPIVEKLPETPPPPSTPNPPSPQLPPVQPQPAKPEPPEADKSDEYNCTYCDIAFKDIVMYTMHMGYHGYQDPFTCNMCGQQTSDKVSFFLHIARTSHS